MRKMFRHTKSFNQDISK
ncbi:hypothetical protein JIY74_33130 [Vibrio harveyi]|nr:hypothetical protein [Vibrio harveyi]